MLPYKGADGWGSATRMPGSEECGSAFLIPAFLVHARDSAAVSRLPEFWWSRCFANHQKI
jgi:hypothetical protein